MPATARDIDTALASHSDFSQRDEGYELTTSPLSSTITSAEGRIDIVVDMPMLSAVATDPPVSAVVEEDWVETMRHRLVDAYDVARSAPASDATVEVEGTSLQASYAVVAEDADVAVGDAKAIVEFALGTFVQSAIPGYTYDEPLAGLLDAASARAHGDS